MAKSNHKPQIINYYKTLQKNYTFRRNLKKITP